MLNRKILVLLANLWSTPNWYGNIYIVISYDPLATNRIYASQAEGYHLQPHNTVLKKIQIAITYLINYE